MSQATPTSPPILHSRYRIEEKLGTGRLAVVYRAYDERLQRQVLVHMLRKELILQEPLRQRFVQEAHSSARRSHQSLLEVYDSGEVAGRPYMVTEYVSGRTLRDLGALSLEEALLYFRQVVGAVAACQVAGVPHPPVSSNNLILVADGHVELVESWLTTTAEVALDIASYRAPERAEGQPATPASAVYSLGLLLIEMLTGRRMISGDDPRVVSQAHLTARVPLLAEMRPNLYVPALDRLIQQTTARRPEQRISDAVALGHALEDLRRTINGDTQRLAVPPVQRPNLRERINRTANEIVAPRPPPRLDPAVPLPDENASLEPETITYQRGRPRQSRRRSLAGMVIVLALFVSVAFGTYYFASMAANRLFNFELPTIDVTLPEMPDPGIELPEWFTGVVSGGGEVLVVTGVADEGLNLRDQPGTTTQVIGLLPNGTLMRKLEGPTTVEGIPWVRVRARVGDQELEGWVSNNFVRPVIPGAQN